MAGKKQKINLSVEKIRKKEKGSFVAEKASRWSEKSLFKTVFMKQKCLFEMLKSLLCA